jgi:hypothetical protein
MILLKEENQMFKHHEFDFFVRSPEHALHCQQTGCKKLGDWSVVAKADDGKIMLAYDNICEQHILQAFIDAACGDF